MPVRLAVVNDYPLIVAGLRAMLVAYEDRVQVVELDFDTPTVSDVDILLIDNFGSAPPFDPDPRVRSGRPDSKVVVFDWGGATRSECARCWPAGPTVTWPRLLQPPSWSTPLSECTRGNAWSTAPSGTTRPWSQAGGRETSTVSVPGSQRSSRSSVEG